MDESETTRLRALLERTATRVLTVAEERDAATKRAERAERERDDLAATLETRTAEHALAMARVRELEYVLRAACDFFGAAWGSDACLRCGATRGHEAHGHGCIIGRMERTLPPAAEVSR